MGSVFHTEITKITEKLRPRSPSPPRGGVRGGVCIPSLKGGGWEKSFPYGNLGEALEAGFRRHLFLFQEVEHLDGALDGSFSLVGIKATGTEAAVVPVPGDNGLHKGIGAATGRDADGIVGEPREATAKAVLVDMANGTDESVELTVALRTLLIGLAVYFEANTC